MLLSDTRFASQSVAGYWDLTEYLTDYDGTGAVNFASRTLMGAKHMWKQPTTTMYDANASGYVLSDGETRFSDMFNADELVLWMCRYPNGAVDVYRAYITEDSIVDDGGIQTLNLPLEASGGYFTGFTNTQLAPTGLASVAVPAGSVLFYWIDKDLVPSSDPNLSDVELNFVVDGTAQDLSGTSAYQGTGEPTDAIKFTQGIYMVDLGITADLTSVEVKFDLTLGSATQDTDAVLTWAYGRLR